MQRIKELLTADDAVSPVIGVILMVAITVILAAVIAAFVLGIGDTDDVAPQTSFDSTVDESEEVFTLEITSGDALDLEDVEIRNNDGFHSDCEESLAEGDCVDGTAPDTLNVGESIDINLEGSGETEVSGNLVWTGDGEDIIKELDGGTVTLS